MPVIAAFLGKVLLVPLKWAGEWLLAEVFSRGLAWIKDAIEQRKRNAALEAELKRLKNATTPEEQEDAHKAILRLRARK